MADLLDTLDLKLIRLLQEDARAPYSRLARETGTSEATAKRRVEALIQNGVVTPAMIPNLSALGFTTSAFVGINVDGHRLEEIAHRIRDLPETTVVTITMGRYDLIIFVATPTLDALTNLVNNQIAAIPGVRTTETFITPRVYKVLRDWRLPLDNELAKAAADAQGAGA